jgi:hypothetical protein
MSIVLHSLLTMACWNRLKAAIFDAVEALTYETNARTIWSYLDILAVGSPEGTVGIKYELDVGPGRERRGVCVCVCVCGSVVTWCALYVCMVGVRAQYVCVCVIVRPPVCQYASEFAYQLLPLLFHSTAKLQIGLTQSS